MTAVTGAGSEVFYVNPDYVMSVWSAETPKKGHSLLYFRDGTSQLVSGSAAEVALMLAAG